MCSLSQYDTLLQAWSNRANQPQTETSKSMAPNKPFLSTSCFTQGMCYSDVKIMQGVQEQENYTENKPKSHTILRYYSRTNQETTASSMKRSQSNQTAQHERYLLIVLTTQVWSTSFPWCLRCIWPPYTGHGIAPLPQIKSLKVAMQK